MSQPLTTIKKKFDFPIDSLDFSVNDTLFIATGKTIGTLEIDERNKQLTHQTWVETKIEATSISCHPNIPLLATCFKNKDTLNCTIYDSDTFQIMTELTSKTIKDEYQKSSRFSKSGRYLVIETSQGKITVLNTNQWTLCFPSLRFNSIQDIDFDKREDHIAIATTTAIIILSIQDGTIVQVIDSPKLNKTNSCHIKSCRYGITENGIETIYAVINSTLKGFICAWTLNKKRRYPVTKVRIAGISRKTINYLTISSKGDILAYASIDSTIGFVDAQSLKPLKRLNKSHDGLIKKLTFNTSGKYLASIGEDNCCSIIKLSNLKENQEFFLTTPIFIVLNILSFYLLMHIIVQMFG